MSFSEGEISGRRFRFVRYTISVPWPGSSHRPVDPRSDRSTGTPDPELVRAALGRILTSRHFSRAEGLCTLLEFVTEQTLKGHGHELKEYRIGTEALGRRQDFDPRLDGIVRVQATKVRARLKEYYATDGRSESIIIDLPKGSYKTEFRICKAAPATFRLTWRNAVAAQTVLVGVIAFWSVSPLPKKQQFAAAVPSMAVLPSKNLSPEAQHNRIKAAQRPVNPLVLDLYRRGLAKLRAASEPEFYEAIKYFEEVVAVDPQYAPGHAGLAESYTQLGLRRLVPIQNVREKAKDAVKRALELDPMLTHAHLLSGQIASDFDSNLTEAERLLRRALELEPGNAEVHRSFAQYAAMPAGRFEEALAHFKQAEELDPFNVYLTTEIGRVLYRLRRYHEAIDRLKAAARRAPQFIDTHVWMGLSYLGFGDYRRAIAELEQAVVLADRAPAELAYFSHAVGRSGDRGRAAALHRELASVASRRYVHPKYLAISLLGSGHVDEAFGILRESLSMGSISPAFSADPIYDSVRSHPRFEALLQTLPMQSSQRN